MDPREFLLYTRDQEESFRTRYATFVRDYLEQYEQWFFATFELYEWKEIALPGKSTEAVIGALCLLMREHRIQFSIRFPDSRTAEIQRGAVTREEFDEYWENHLKK